MLTFCHNPYWSEAEMSRKDAGYFRLADKNK
jgi:hypothetical protein